MRSMGTLVEEDGRFRLYECFIDETLVHSIEKERLGARKLPGFDNFAHGSYVTFLRPEALAILEICREWAQEVVLFTFSEAAYAREISQAFGFGFAANQVFGCELFVFGEKDLSPAGALIDDLPPGHENARLKMRTLVAQRVVGGRARAAARS